MQELHKTIFYSVIAICTTAIALFALHVFTRPAGVDSNSNSNYHMTKDKLTNCVQVLMSESRQSAKVVDAEKATEMCIKLHKEPSK